MRGLVHCCSICKEEGVSGEILYVDDSFSEINPSSYDTGSWMCEPCIEKEQEPKEMVKVYGYHVQVGEEIFEVEKEHVSSFIEKLQSENWESVTSLEGKVCVHCGQVPDKREIAWYESGEVFCIDCGVECARDNQYSGYCPCNQCKDREL